MTVRNERAHAAYANAPEHIRNAVDRAFDAARTSLRDSELNTANDDRAENLVAEIFIFVCASNAMDWSAWVDAPAEG